MTLLPFLTAWDPSDLPGTSVDPLGFDRGYTCLSDLWLPGLTNVASQPRYFSILCAGAYLAPKPDSSGPTRAEIEARQQCVLRLERLWALGHAILAADIAGTASGLRGVTYANIHLETLKGKGSSTTTSKFRLLQSQVRYGALGIYGNVASGLRLTVQGTLELTPDLGEELGRTFLDTTDTPLAIRRATTDPHDKTEVPLDVLAEWVTRAGVNAPMTADETSILTEALTESDTRKRVASYLRSTRWDPQEEGELVYLQKLGKRIRSVDDDLKDIAKAIELFEDCYRRSTLLLDRLLWRCDSQLGCTITELARDQIFGEAATALPASVHALQEHLDQAPSGVLRAHSDRFSDLTNFLSDMAETRGDIATAIPLLLQRHALVQGGKIVRGRAKLPWLELESGRLQATMARASQQSGEPKTHDSVEPHGYRLRSARALLFGNAGNR